MTQSPTDDLLACPACGAQLESGDIHCARCGRTVQVGISTVAEARQPKSDDRRTIDRPWFVLALLFCATAAFGLPALWKSRGFSLAAKVLLSLLVTVYTAILLWGFSLLMSWCATRIVDALL